MQALQAAKKTYKKKAGAYKKKYKKAKRANQYSDLAGEVGGLIGSMVPIPGAGTVGKALGRLAGKVIPSIFDHGDYVMAPFSVKSNNIVTDSSMPPRFSSTDKKTVICHREYIGDIFSGSLVGSYTTFTKQYFPINPGVSTLFPWLSGLAQNYECYKIHGMVVEFKSMSADALNSTNTGLGTVIVATSYNAAIPDPFANKQAMENYEYGQSCKPSQSMLHPIECARSETVLNEMYIRTGGVPSGTDPRLYDLGNVCVATQGMQAANVNLGELWVTYCIEFFKPKNTSAIGGALGYAHYYGTTGVTTANWCPSTSVASFTSNIPLVLNANTITFPSNIIQGNYVINFALYQTSGSSVQPPSPLFTSNCQNLLAITGGVKYYTNQGAVTSQTLIFSVYLTIIGPNAVISFTGGSAPTTLTNYDISVFEIVSPLN